MDERYQSLLGRASRAFADRPVGEAVARVRALVGVPKVPDSEHAAQVALDKLNSNQAPTPIELAALELVIRMMRAAPLSQNGTLAPLPTSAGANTYNPATSALWDGFCQKVQPYLYSIGRLDRASGQDPAVGTGFLVADGVVMTNRHVLDDLSFGAAELELGQAVIRFHQEYGCIDRMPPVPVTGVLAIHPTLDLALLRIEPSSRPVPQFEPGTVATSTDVATIGYPFKDDINNPLFADAVFGGKYGVKRAAIGEVMSATSTRLFHDCSTLGGNSGSPLFSLATARIVGVHFSGTFMYRNEAVPATEASAFVAASIQTGAGG